MTHHRITEGPTKAYLGDGLYAEIERNMLKLTAEDGYNATETVYLERSVWKMLTHYMERYGAQLIGLALALCGLAGPARAEELTFNMVVSPSGFGLFWTEQLAVFQATSHATELAFGPTDYYDNILFDLGRPDAPWRNAYFQNAVSAESFVAHGAAGLNTVIRVGRCELTIQGGLIVAADRCR
jgi:hypothetical protein